MSVFRPWFLRPLIDRLSTESRRLSLPISTGEVNGLRLASYCRETSMTLFTPGRLKVTSKCLVLLTVGETYRTE